MDELLERLANLFPDERDVLDLVTHFKQQLKQAQDMYHTAFYKHSSYQSQCGSHCRCFLLSETFGQAQATACLPEAHADENQKQPTPLQPFEEWVRDTHPELVDEDGVVEDTAWNERCGCWTFDRTLVPGHAAQNSAPPLLGSHGCGKGGQVESRQPLMCEHCPNVVHNSSICLYGIKNQSKLDAALDDFVCAQCVKETDAEFHVNSCSECNILPHALAGIRRLLEALAKLGHQHSPDIARYLQGRFDKFESNLDNFVAHKIQDRHMVEAFAQELDGMQQGTFMCLADYAAKRFGLRSKMTQQDGYGQGAGRLSQHICTMFQKARPCDVNEEYAPEQLNEILIVTMHNTCTDNASQGALSS